MDDERCNASGAIRVLALALPTMIMPLVTKALVVMKALMDKTATWNELGLPRVLELSQAARLNACAADVRMTACRTWAGRTAVAMASEASWM